MVVCKFILLVFSGGNSLLFSVPLFMGSEQEAGGSLSPELAVVLDAQKNAFLTAVNAQNKVSRPICFKRSEIWPFK